MPTSGNATSPNKEYVPPKEWDELTSEEKIERMREIIKNLSSSLNYTGSQIHTLRRKLANHEHKDGKVMEQKQITEYDNELGGALASSQSSNKYF